MSCVVCGRPSSFWFSSHMFFMRTVGYCGPTCRMISNRLWMYLGGIGALFIGYMFAQPLLLLIGGIGFIAAFYASSKNKQHNFPLFNFESVIDNY